jgi:hypothetical protein
MTATTDMCKNNQSTDIQVIDQPQPNKESQTKNQKSWVWVHFKLVETNKVECQVFDKATNRRCDQTLKKDPTGSTKSMIEHLKRIHGISSPKEGTDQLLLPNFLKRQRVEQRVSHLNLYFLSKELHAYELSNL